MELRRQLADHEVGTPEYVSFILAEAGPYGRRLPNLNRSQGTSGPAEGGGG
jgi:hypothetical protein